MDSGPDVYETTSSMGSVTDLVVRYGAHISSCPSNAEFSSGSFLVPVGLFSFRFILNHIIKIVILSAFFIATLFICINTSLTLTVNDRLKDSDAVIVDDCEVED